ncbi:MAG TPA: NAD-dependent epimerase/dehydratase family protein [Sedimentisphaerales bacterium]|nr:NAD-dependent epimerase/dehydratase family protein [Sedimentisphaerales bacterium]
MNKLRVGITGMSGFIGSHLRDRLVREEGISVLAFEDSYFEQPDNLKAFLSEADVVAHLAAMNRGDPDEIYNVNVSLVKTVVAQMDELGVRPHVIFSSSIQNALDNPYGRSKRDGEHIFEEWSGRTNAPVTVLTIPNVYGDSGLPHYNSVVATFCYELSQGAKPQIHVDKKLSLIYINELTEIILEAIESPPAGFEKVSVQETATVKVSEVLALLEKFRDYYFGKKIVPAFKNRFEQSLYTVFLTYLSNADYLQKSALHCDDRGALFEVIKLEQGGQIFYSTTKPGIVRGNHYHTRKLEKFCVIKGTAIIRLRRIGTDNVIEYRVSGQEPAFVEMPIFYTHNIENVGQDDLHTLFWTNELYDPADPDTFYEQV